MTLELYAAYLVATTVLLVLPGPTVMLVVNYALAEGRRSAWPTLAGVAAGDLVAMSCSLAGVGAILSTSGTLFTALKWAGAAYLVYLGVRMWRSAPGLDGKIAEARPRAALPMAGHAFVVTALNPKGILFFIAFLPQFVSPGRRSWRSSCCSVAPSSGWRSSTPRSTPCSRAACAMRCGGQA